jgi:hypothetical protein
VVSYDQKNTEAHPVDDHLGDGHSTHGGLRDIAKDANLG